jgi:hypothetical protein
MPGVTVQPVNAEAGGHGPSDPPCPGTRPDWRGWIVLVWVLVWGWAYALMAIQARSPQLLEWMRALARAVFPGDPNGPG